MKYLYTLMILALMSCASVPQPTQNMGNVEKNTSSVTVTQLHVDVLGFGNTKERTAEEYQTLVNKAFENSPLDTKRLKNTTLVRQVNNIPQALGGVMMATGAITSFFAFSLRDVVETSNGFGSVSTSSELKPWAINAFIASGILGFLGVIAFNTHIYDDVLTATPLTE